jgi:hypothetical protein
MKAISMDFILLSVESKIFQLLIDTLTLKVEEDKQQEQLKIKVRIFNPRVSQLEF